MSTCIRYKISNRLKVNNAAFCKPSDINPITGNPIYRDFFTHSDQLFVSRYQLYLPNREQLESEINRILEQNQQ